MPPILDFSDSRRMRARWRLAFAGAWACSTLTACLDDEMAPSSHFLKAALSADETASPPDSGGSDVAATGEWQMGPNARSEPLPDLSSFIAVQRDFAGYQDWFKTDLGTGGHPRPQPEGELWLYINRLPEPASNEFAVGTMIVKELQLGGPASTWQVHAMVKRGSDFNQRGAYGWEFFDLALKEDGAAPTLNWRGENPPDGESYQLNFGSASSDPDLQELVCNDCHMSSTNDAVLSAPLNLESF